MAYKIFCLRTPLKFTCDKIDVFIEAVKKICERLIKNRPKNTIDTRKKLTLIGGKFA